jgi:hypothetical protein
VHQVLARASDTLAGGFGDEFDGILEEMNEVLAA